jgi:hypothetical protein
VRQQCFHSSKTTKLITFTKPKWRYAYVEIILLWFQVDKFISIGVFQVWRSGIEQIGKDGKRSLKNYGDIIKKGENTMKELKVLKFTFLIIGMLIMSNRLEASSISFTTPTEGAIYYCFPGYYGADVYFSWTYTSNVYHYFKLYIDGDQNGINCGVSPYFTLSGMAIGPHNAVVMLWEWNGSTYVSNYWDTRHFTITVGGLSISGPSSLTKGKTGTYVANISGGSGSFTYQWYRQTGSTWYATSGAINRTQDYFMGGMINIPIRVDVHDNNNGSNGTAYFTIYYDNGNLAKNSNPSFSGQGDIPTTYTLSSYPNPFNPTTTITYQLPEAGYVMLKVFDIMGREVALLQDGMKGAGSYTATFDASRLTSGIYFSRLTVQPQEGNPIVQTNKLILMK